MEMEKRSKKRTLEQEQDDIKLIVKGQVIGMEFGTTFQNLRSNIVAVETADGVNVFFQISRTRPLLKLLQTYCFKRNSEYKDLEFLYNGLRFSAKRTPDELGMQDNDEIEAMTHQSGGGSVVVRK